MKMVRWINILGLLWLSVNSISSFVGNMNKGLVPDYQKENFSIDHLNLNDVRGELVNNFDFNDLKLEEFKIGIAVEKLLSKKLALLGRNKIFKRIQMLVKKQIFSKQENNDFFELVSKTMAINREMWNSSFFFKKIRISSNFYLDNKCKKLASYEDIISGKTFYLKIIGTQDLKGELIVPVKIIDKEDKIISKVNEVVALKNSSFNNSTLEHITKSRNKRAAAPEFINLIFPGDKLEITHDWYAGHCNVTLLIKIKVGHTSPMSYKKLQFVGKQADYEKIRTSWGNTAYRTTLPLFGDITRVFETKKILNKNIFCDIERKWTSLKRIIVQEKQQACWLFYCIEFSQEIVLIYYHLNGAWYFEIWTKQCGKNINASQRGSLFLNLGDKIQLFELNPNVASKTNGVVNNFTLELPEFISFKFPKNTFEIVHDWGTNECKIAPVSGFDWFIDPMNYENFQFVGTEEDFEKIRVSWGDTFYRTDLALFGDITKVFSTTYELNNRNIFCPSVEEWYKLNKIVVQGGIRFYSGPRWIYFYQEIALISTNLDKKWHIEIWANQCCKWNSYFQQGGSLFLNLGDKIEFFNLKPNVILKY